MEVLCSEALLWRVGLVLVVAGFAVALAAALLALLTAPGGAVGIGGCVLILFVPVCFGVGQQALHLLVAAVALSILLLVAAFLIWRTLARGLQKAA